MSDAVLAHPNNIDLVTLDHIVTNYNCQTDHHLTAELPKLETQLWHYICNYDADTRLTMTLGDHICRLSNDTAVFLKKMGFEEKAAKNVRHAMLFSKLGYVHADNMHAGFTAEGPVSRDEHATARDFAAHGRAVLRAALADYSTELQAHPHIRIVIPALMDFRHECINGRGPHGCDGGNMGLIIRVAAMADSFERQFLHTPASRKPQSAIEAIERMSSADEADMPMNIFDRNLLESYARFQLDRQNAATDMTYEKHGTTLAHT